MLFLPKSTKNKGLAISQEGWVLWLSPTRTLKVRGSLYTGELKYAAVCREGYPKPADLPLLVADLVDGVLYPGCRRSQAASSHHLRQARKK